MLGQSLVSHLSVAVRVVDDVFVLTAIVDVHCEHWPQTDTDINCDSVDINAPSSCQVEQLFY